MKTRVNLTVESRLLTLVKLYAQKKKLSVSELVENYFENLTKTAKGPNVLDLIDQLEKPVIDTNLDLKEAYYKDQAKKHGF